MQTSTDRILTTHTGSIARPDDLIELMRARARSTSRTVREVAREVIGHGAETLR